MLPTVLGLGPEKTTCRGSKSHEEGPIEERVSCRMEIITVIFVWAVFSSYQVLCHSLSHSCFAALVKGVDIFLVLFLHLRKLSL